MSLRLCWFLSGIVIGKEFGYHSDPSLRSG
jgi:hypothetical protein